MEGIYKVVITTDEMKELGTGHDLIEGIKGDILNDARSKGMVLDKIWMDPSPDNDGQVIIHYTLKPPDFESISSEMFDRVAHGVPGIKDSGERSVYPSGAQRDNQEGKGRFDLISTQGLFRLARWYELGAKKYSDRNWEKGMNVSRYVDAALRHFFKFIAGCDDEDHLAAVLWNVLCIMHHFEKFPELVDLPEWKGRTSKWFYKLDKE